MNIWFLILQIIGKGFNFEGINQLELLNIIKIGGIHLRAGLIDERV